MRRCVRGLRSWSKGREEVKLSFKCTGCGKCCTGKGGRVRVNERELQELAAATDRSVREFKHEFTREVQEDVDGLKRTQVVLLQTPDDKQCVFLKGSKCTVYQARPTQCRTFPWWPQHLVSDYDWQLAAADCEGIHVHENEAATSFSFDDVLPETILHDIHRSGENYTYDELAQLLRDLRDVDPDFVEQYKAEFVAKFSREIVYSDDMVTVMDSFIAGEKPTRSFVFNDRLHLTQSEVALEEKGLNAFFDRSTLALDVHRVLCMPVTWLLEGKHQSKPLRVAVLGAGACALPLFLLEHLPASALEHLGAVEPSSEVNAIAKRFFGVDAVLQQDPRLSLHEEMGEEFLSKQTEDDTLDLLIVDVEAGASWEGVRAPPHSMLNQPFLLTARRLLGSHGILAINVIAESDAGLRAVETNLRQVFPRGLRLSLPSNTIFFAFGNDANAEIDTYLHQIRASAFQTQHARTPELLEKHCLTPWSSSRPL